MAEEVAVGCVGGDFVVVEVGSGSDVEASGVGVGGDY